MPPARRRVQAEDLSFAPGGGEAREQRTCCGLRRADACAENEAEDPEDDLPAGVPEEDDEAGDHEQAEGADDHGARTEPVVESADEDRADSRDQVGGDPKMMTPLSEKPKPAPR